MVVYCIVCNEELSRTNYTINKMEHQESDWIVDKIVTTTDNGLQHKECIFCELLMSEEILYAGSQGMEYTLMEDGTYAVSGRGSCTDSKVYIPRAYQGIPVTRIEYYAFAYQEGITEIVFGKNITSIVDYAFNSCSDLEAVHFTGTLADWCSITFDSQTANPGFSSKDVYINGELMSGDLIIPADVTHINDFALYGWGKLTSITLSEGIKTIGTQAFGNCSNLKSITFPDSVTKIGAYALSHCRSLENITFNGSKCQWTNITKSFGWNSATGDYVIFYTAGDHIAGDIVLENEIVPDCINDGSYDNVIYCTKCKTEISRETIQVEALDHTEVIDTAVAATCTTTGLTEGKHCSVCNVILVEQNLVSAIGHSYDDNYDDTCNACGFVRDADCPHTNTSTIVGREPTCTESGLTDGVKCDKCNEVLTEQTTIPATGHTEIIDAAVAPTCTETGLTEGKHCAVCDEILIAQTVVAAIGHTEVIDAAVDATCTTAGLTEGKHCSVCNTILVEQTIVSAIGHSYDDNYDDTCNTCGFVREADCPHANTSTIAGYEPTCTESGLTDGVKCDKCDEVLTEQTTIPAVGHTEVIDAAVAATCTTAGLTGGKHCSVCDEVLIAQTIISALGHTEVIDKAVSATCTTTGLTKGKHCSVCDKILVAQTVVAVLGHIKVIDAAVAATCTTTGLTEGSHCKACGETILAQEVIKALGHKYEIGVTAPTCTESGYTTYICSVCGDTYIDDVVEAHGHTIVTDTAVSPTCTTTGLTEGEHCSDCDEVLIAQTIVDALGHTEIIDAAIPPNCTTTGLTDGKHCSICDEVLVAQITIEALGHNFEEGSCTQCNISEAREYSEYRYRGKEYTTSTTELESPWVLSHTSTKTEHSGYDYVYLRCYYESGTGTPGGYTSGEADSWKLANYNNYCFHGSKVQVLKYLRKAGYYSGSAELYVTNSNSVDLTKYYFEGTYWQFRICTHKTSYTEYHYYQWGEWSEWSDIIVTPTEDREIETRTVYSIVYDANGGTTAPDIQVKIQDEDITLSAFLPEREGFSFQGWSTSVNGEVEFLPGEVYSDNNCVTLYAVWKSNTYTVSYDANGGENAPAEQSQNEGENIVLSLDIPVREEYSFKGWSTSADGDVEYCAGDIYSASNSVILYAVWELSQNENTTILASGTCGDNLTWTLYDDGSLYINGTGDMKNYAENNTSSSSRAPWYSYTSDIVQVLVGDDVTSIGNYAFWKCSNLTSISIGNMVETIGNGVFRDCTKLSNVIMSDTVQSIGQSAFAGCIALESIILPNGLEVVHRSVFSGCTNLTKIVIPNAVKCIDSTAFAGCSNLESVTIPDSVVIIGEYAFDECVNLKAVYITDLAKWCNIDFLNSISNPLFYAHELYVNGKLVSELVVPESVTNISEYAFYRCSSLTAVTITQNVESIGNSAFYGCSNIEKITFVVANGWHYGLDYTDEDGIAIDVSDPTNTAKYLTDTYKNYYWYHK